MPKNIFLDNINYNHNQDKLLRNIRLTIELNGNLIISPKQAKSKDEKSCISLLRIIAGAITPSSGRVRYSQPDDNRLLIGYKNFDVIFKRGVRVDELINTVIRTQSISNQNLIEIKELKSMLKVSDFNHKLTTELSEHQARILNLLTLLIIKPHAIVLESLDLFGSDFMKSAILSYIKKYCDTYNISLITTSTDKNVIEIIADRKVVIYDSKIINDALISKRYEATDKDVDNKTKAFDLEDAVIAISSNNKVPYDSEYDDGEPEVSSRDTEKELIKNVTRALDDLFVDEIDNDIKKANKTNKVSSITNDLFTNRYTDEFIETSEIVDEYDEPINLSKRLTGSLEFEKEEIKQKTRQLNEDSLDVLEDIKIANKRNSSIPTRQVTRSIDARNPTTRHQTGFLEELRETYLIRKELEQQIKSDSFTSLNPDLQAKVYTNYDRADKLIKETDPKGYHDPFRTKMQDFDNDAIKETVTKMIFEEEIFTSPIDEDTTEDYMTKTSEFETDAIENRTLDSVIDNVKTNAYFDNDDDFTIKPTTKMFKTTRKSSSLDSDYLTSSPIEEVLDGDQEYFDNEKAKKSSSWRERFKKKTPDKDLSESIYGPEKTKTYKTDKYEEPTDEFDNFTLDLSKDKTEEINDYSDDSTDYFEPRSNTTSDLLKTSSPTNVIKPTREFRTNRTNPTRRSTSSFTDEYKPLKTMAIKTRSKKNKIEQLYDEAIEDAEIIDDIKDKKNK